MDKETIIAELDKEAESHGNCRCCSCGYVWKRGKDGSHSCSEHMTPKDVLKIVLKQNLGENSTVLNSILSTLNITN